MRDRTVLKKAAEALLAKANIYDYEGKSFDAVEIYARKIESSNVLLKAGTIKQVNTEDKLEIAMRIVSDDNLGAAVSTSFDDETLIERAVLSLKHQKSEPTPFPNEVETAVDSVSDEVLECDVECHVNRIIELNERFLKVDADLDLNIGSEVGVKDTYMCNSNGFSAGYSNTFAKTYVTSMTKQGFRGVSTIRSSAALVPFTEEEIEAFVKKHHLSETPVEFKGGRMPVIFSGNAMGSLMMRLLGGVDGGNITKQTSPLTTRLGEKVFSDKLNVRDDGTYAYGVNTRAFDDEGTPSQNNVIVEDGILKSFMVTQGQAVKLTEQLGKTIKPKGNATKRTFFSMEIEDSPTVSETNLIVDGDRTPDEEILGAIDHGVLITSVMGAHTGNIVAGEFSLNIGSGYLIEKGELKGKVQGAMVAGNIYDFFNEVEALGIKDEIMNGIFYPIGISPMVAFREANVIVSG